MLSRPITYWFDAAGGGELQSSLDGSPIERNILICLIATGLAALLARRVNWPAVFSEYKVVWLFYVYAFLSALWSPYPVVTAKRVIRELGDVVMILMILTAPNSLDAMKRVFMRCIVVLVPLSVLFIKYYPAIGRYQNRWTYKTMYSGVTTNKNSLGLLAMVGGLLLLSHLAESGEYRKRWRGLASVWPEVGVLLLCLWIINLADSATALVSFILGVLVFIASRTICAGASVKATVWGVAAVVLAGVVALSVSGLREVFTQGVGRRSDLTDRTAIWAAALALPTNPIVGAGFSSVWLTPEGLALSKEQGFLSHSHNGYLETYLNGGVIGLALLIGILLLAAVQAGRHLSAKTPAGSFYIAFLLAGIVYNFTEVTFNYGNAVGLLLWLIALSNPTVMLVRPDVALRDRWRRKSANPMTLDDTSPQSYRPSLRNDRYTSNVSRCTPRS
jgi:O-antigen ligase